MRPALAIVFTLAMKTAAQDHRVVVEGATGDNTVATDTASSGSIDAADLQRRPLARVADLLEAVPGLAVTQHSGGGKGNQMYLRGFDLDHGTDLRTTVAGIPVNLPSHAHGQGYTDLGFLIPELVQRVDFRKGPYVARDGDFASAGAIDIDYVRRLDRGIAQVEVGAFGHGRALVAWSVPWAKGDLLLGLEGRHADGPFTVGDDHDRGNAVLRWSRGDEAEGASLTLLAHDGEWRATDQIPARAVARGELGRFDTLDGSDGGSTRQVALHGAWWRERDEAASRAAVWARGYEFDLFSNFTYALADPVAGDQIEQTDRRVAIGGDVEQRWFGALDGVPVEHALGIQVRSDLARVGLHRTQARRRIGTVRQDDVGVHQLGVFGEQRVQWTDRVRTTLGLRGDAVAMDVDSDLAANSGDRTGALLSPRFGVALRAADGIDLFANAGFGFHSNDSRGATLRDDPTTAAPGDGARVRPLVRSRGAEVGVRAEVAPGFHNTLTAFVLDTDSELVFAGDAGTTEAGPAARRAGFEWSGRYAASDCLDLDAEATWTRARARSVAPGRDAIVGAIETQASAGLTAHGDVFFASLRTRYVGPRPLTEDGSVRSRVAWRVDLRLGARIDERTTITLDALNLLDEADADVEYAYASRRFGEPSGPDDGGYADVHFHPAEPFALRLAVTTRF